MNAYFVTLPEPITVGMSYDPPDPGETYFPCGIFVAETRGQAKAMFVASDNHLQPWDDFLSARVRILERDVDLPAGEVREPRTPRHLDVPPPTEPWMRLWGRVHEVEDHGGKPCDCPDTFVWSYEEQRWVDPRAGEAGE